MGLKEYIQAGASLQRDAISITTNADGSGSIDLGSAYILYTLHTNQTCRLRLYDKEGSVNDATEQSRGFGNTNIPDSIALVGDFTMSIGTYTLDPLLYAVSDKPLAKTTYYKIDNALTPPIITFHRYLLENSSVSTGSRMNLPNIIETLSPTQRKTGTIASPSVPKTYLLVSASVQNTSAPIRIRLYNLVSALTNATEQSRPYEVESQTTSLIVDAVLTSTEVTHFTPKIIGANLQNMGTDLSVIKNNFLMLAGKSELYYTIENLATSGPTDTVTVSFNVFSLED
jgi:hypothetical protein